MGSNGTLLNGSRRMVAERTFSHKMLIAWWILSQQAQLRVMHAYRKLRRAKHTQRALVDNNDVGCHIDGDPGVNCERAEARHNQSALHRNWAVGEKPMLWWRECCAGRDDQLPAHQGEHGEQQPRAIWITCSHVNGVNNEIDLDWRFNWRACQIFDWVVSLWNIQHDHWRVYSREKSSSFVAFLQHLFKLYVHLKLDRDGRFFSGKMHVQYVN